MRVSQLLESTDFSPLESIWKGQALENMITTLKKLGDEEAELLGTLIDDARDKADARPEKIISFVEPLLDLQTALYARANGANGTYFLRTFSENVQALLDAIVAAVMKIGDPAVLMLAAKTDVNKLYPKLSQNHVALKLAVKKARREKDQVEYDEENDTFVFIARPAFVESPEGSGNFKKSIEIENLIKIDSFDAKSHQMVGMMKLRARAQGEKSEVYKVNLPKDLVKERSTHNVPEWLIDIIDKHKQEVK